LSPESDQTKNLKANGLVQTLRISIKNIANDSPLRGKLMAKVQNFDTFGGCIPIFLPDKREIWHRERTAVPNFMFIGATYCPCRA